MNSVSLRTIRDGLENWVIDQMSNTIKRKDPEKPGFYYLSYPAPHPPPVPLPYYWDLYKNMEIPDAATGDWVDDTRGPIKALTSK